MKTLTAIVHGILKAAQTNPGVIYSQELGRGLKVGIRLTGGIIQLYLSRGDKYPSNDEMGTVVKHWPDPILTDWRIERRTHLKRFYLTTSFVAGRVEDGAE